MLFNLKYGKGELPVEIPDSVRTEVIEPPGTRPVGSLEHALFSALEKPIVSPPLRGIVPASGEVAIVVSDKTRPCPYPRILPLLLDSLNANGLADDRMFLLVAYGAHRRHTEEENRGFYGEHVLRRVRLFHHDSRDSSRLVHVGRTSRGTPVALNKEYLKAAMSIVVASVSFHYFAGFGGGRKLIFPGLASEDGILKNHRIFVEAGGGSILKMRAFEANLESNPLNGDLMEAVALAPPSFAINLCLNREGEVSGVFAGDWKQSHLRACQSLKETLVRPKRKYDLVIASCGGHPKDVNFIQSHKTIDNAFDFVKPGGTIVVLACCEDGIGSDSFLRWFEHRDATAMRKALLEDYSMNGGTALALKMKIDVCKICLCSSLEKNTVEKMGLCPILNLRQDLGSIMERASGQSVAVLPEGAMTIAEREAETGQSR